jgi:uncharacterized protein with HEPN domain
MKRDDLVYVGHMLDVCRLIAGKMTGKKRADFDADDDFRVALAHRIQTLGEAARRVSPEFQEAHPQVPWKKIIGMRHKVVHDYLFVNYDVVWDAVTINVPVLVAQLDEIVPPDATDTSH